MDIILNTYGTSISRDNEGFVVTKEGTRQRVPVAGITSIQISKGAQITSDAVLLAIENEIEVLFVSRDGHPQGRVWSNKYGSISTIRKGQLAFSHKKTAVNWIKGVLSKKVESQQALLLTMNCFDTGKETAREQAIAAMETYRGKIERVEGELVLDVASKLRGWEGGASKIYFECLNMFLPEEYRFECRSQHPAMDIANALLNYGYGVLYGKIESALVRAGIDPYIGIMHRDNYNRPVLVYDVIEMYRTWVDYVVCSLLCQKIVTDEFYSVASDGSYWLEQLGRRILIQALNDYLEEVVTIKGVARSRSHQIFMYCQNLAQTFKNMEGI